MNDKRDENNKLLEEEGIIIEENTDNTTSKDETVDEKHIQSMKEETFKAIGIISEDVQDSQTNSSKDTTIKTEDIKREFVEGGIEILPQEKEEQEKQN